MRRRLSGRQSQIMRLLYRLGEASVAELSDAMADPPSDSTLRTTLARMEREGLVEREYRVSPHIYRPARDHDEAASDAADQLLDTFFGGSVSSLVSGLLSDEDRRLPDEELEALQELVREARRRRSRGPGSSKDE